MGVRLLGGKPLGHDLPKDPDELLGQGYRETSHPDAVRTGTRTFQNDEIGENLEFHKAKDGMSGNKGKDHYHRYNTDPKLGKRDKYLDQHGNPCAKGSPESHLFPEGKRQ